MNTTCTPRTDGSGLQSSAPVGVKPRYTVDGDKSAYALRIEMPGVKKEDVALKLESDVLTIEARRRSSAPSDWKALHRELSEDDYVLRLKLNAPVDENKLTATLEHGVLHVALPVKDAAKPRTIPVS